MIDRHLRTHGLTLEASTFRSVRDTNPAPWSGTIGELLGDRHQVTPKKILAGCFAAARYRPDATRGRAGVAAVTALVFDFDHVSRSDSRRLFDSLTRLASVRYTSFSHLRGGPDDLCYRVLIPCDREMTPQEYPVVWHQLNEDLGGLADPAARDTSRIWYLPSCPPERLNKARIAYRDGDLLAVDDLLDRARSSLGHTTGARGIVGHEAAATTPSEPIGTGGRSAHLTSIAGVLRRRGVSEAPILAALLAENGTRCLPPLEEAEVRSIARSISRYEPSSPLLTANLTDVGNAERFVAHVGRDLRYLHLSETWFVWSGQRWRKDETGAAMRLAYATARAVADKAAGIEDERHRVRLERHALKCENASRIHSMLRLATSLLPITPNELDRSPWLLNCANGTLDLETGQLREHRREDLLTRLAPVAYTADAECPRWLDFLHHVMAGNDEMVAFLQRAVGYSLTGSTAEQVLFLLHGIGANGKSTFIETVRALLGDYATQADFTTFLRQQGDGVRNDVARLVGARFVSAVEAEGGKPLAEAMVKQLTGGDTVTARFLFKEYFEFTPAFKLWLAANSRPTVRGTDNGIWRRIRLVPFTVTIPPEARDRDLASKLAAELPGILAWAVRGALQWQAEGLGVPAEVEDATAAYRDDMDVLGGFISDRCVVRGDFRSTSAELYAAYTGWCDTSGERPITQRRMGMKLVERGFAPCKGSKGVRMWSGIALLAERADDCDAPD